MKSPSLNESKLPMEGVDQGSNINWDNSTLSAAIKRALARSGMSYSSFVRCITQNAFSSLVVWGEADMERLLLTCEALGLSPVERDVYATRKTSGAGLQISVSIDGWSRIVNKHPQFDGMEFEESEELVGGVPKWIRCTIHRRDRRVAMSVKEYLCESVRDTGAWQTHPRRMLRHKVMVQCARLAFELPASSCIYDPDETERIGNASSQIFQVPAQQKNEAESIKHDHTVDPVGIASAAITASETHSNLGSSESHSQMVGQNELDEANDIRASCKYGNTHEILESNLMAKSMTQQMILVPAHKLSRAPSSTQQIIDDLTRQSAL